MIKGQVWTIRNLLYAALLPSGNDAAYGLAECTIEKLYPNNNWTARQRIDEFAKLMNETAKELGMYNSHFMTPDGNSYYTNGSTWDIRLSDHYVCAADMCVLANYAFRIPEIAEVVRTSHIDILVGSKNFSFNNTNLLLRPDSQYYLNYIVGLKTGTTTPAGYCLITGAFKNNRFIIVVVLKATSTAARNTDSRAIYAKIFG